MKVKPQIKGMEKVLRKIASFGDEARKEVVKATAGAAKDIATEATQNAPKMYKYADGEEEHVNGEISQSIFSEKISDTFWKVSVNSVMGAYAEFGTGAYVEVPRGWENIAWSYYVNGKGIMLPQPYFYPAWIKGKKQYMKDLKDALHGLQQKYGK